jgi:uncharacterized protein
LTRRAKAAGAKASRSKAALLPPCLLDGNVLVALVSSTHIHHASAQAWFAGHAAAFATCPITQGTLMRLLLRLEEFSLPAALEVLHGISSHPRHRFWADDLSYGDIAWQGVIGHRQVTDAYLASLARHHQGRLVSFDSGLAALHPDVAVLLQA